MTSAFEAIGTRAANGEAAFIKTLQEIANLSDVEGSKVLSLFYKEKIAKMDYGIGRVQVKHGAFMERDVIRRAAGLA